MRSPHGWVQILLVLALCTRFRCNDDVPPPPLTTFPSPPLPGRVSLSVLAFRRPSSLARLLTSLVEAVYPPPPTTVDLDILIDSPEDKWTEEHEETLRIADEFVWPHGDKTLVWSVKNLGTIGQWLKGYAVSYGTTEDVYVIVLEDDCVVSPYYLLWVFHALRVYRYTPSHQSGQICALALQNQHVSLNNMQFHDLFHDNKPYLYQLPSTWGPVLFPEHWREFRKWWASMQGTGFRPTPYAETNRISLWFMRFQWENRCFTLYSRFSQSRAMIVSYQEAGVHSSVTEGKLHDLVVKETYTDDLYHFPPPSSLLAVDVYGYPTSLTAPKCDPPHP